MYSGVGSACRKSLFSPLNKFSELYRSSENYRISMAQDTLLGFPAHTLPYRRGKLYHFIGKLKPTPEYCVLRGGFYLTVDSVTEGQPSGRPPGRSSPRTRPDPRGPCGRRPPAGGRWACCRSRSRMMAVGRRSKTFFTASSSFSSGHRAGAEGIHQHADRAGPRRWRRPAATWHLPGQSGRHDVLGHPAGRVGGGAVHLGGVLAGEARRRRGGRCRRRCPR